MMDTTSSGPQDPGSPGGPQSVDAEARFLESLLTVFKDNRDVLHRLPDMIEQHLKKEPLNPDLAESGPKEENRKLVERGLKKKDKLLEESEKRGKHLEEECAKLKEELVKKEKEISETGKAQEEKLLKEKDEKQQIYDDYQKALKKHKSSHDDLINELAAKDQQIQEYMQSLSKMKEELSNAHKNVDFYKSRLASVSEKRVKQDQRLVEDTLSLNRQSELETDFLRFFDEERMDVCDKMQSIYHNTEDHFVFIYYPRLACIIFETAYEQVKEAKEVATDEFKELIKVMINFAPFMGKEYSKARKIRQESLMESFNMEQFEYLKVPLTLRTQSDGTECSNDVIYGMMLSLKEAAHTCNLDCLMESVLTVAYEKWKKWCLQDKSCLFTPAWHFMQDLDKYIKACIRLTWRMVTQVPPMKLEFHSSRFSKDIHKKMGYHDSVERRPRNNQPAHQDQGEEIACYLWPGLQDGGGRLIRAGEVICKVKET